MIDFETRIIISGRIPSAEAIADIAEAGGHTALIEGEDAMLSHGDNLHRAIANAATDGDAIEIREAGEDHFDAIIAALETHGIPFVAQIHPSLLAGTDYRTETIIGSHADGDYGVQRITARDGMIDASDILKAAETDLEAVVELARMADNPTKFIPSAIEVDEAILSSSSSPTPTR